MATLAQPAVQSGIEVPKHLRFGATYVGGDVLQTADALITPPPAEVGLDRFSDFSEIVQEIIDGIEGSPAPLVCVVNHSVDPTSQEWVYSLNFGVRLTNGYPALLTNGELAVGRGNVTWSGELGASERANMDMFIAVGYIGDGRPAVVILNPGAQPIDHIHGDPSRIKIVDSARQFASTQAMKKVPARTAA